MKAHWTARSNNAFLYKVVDDFIIQLEKKMEAANISQGRLAKKLRISKGRVSQVLNNPGNVSLRTVIKFARSLNLKVALVAYEDNDPKNTKGPISPEVFMGCWEKHNKPRDLWETKSLREDQALSVPLSVMDQCWSLPESSLAGWGFIDVGASAVPDPETFFKVAKVATETQSEAVIVG